MQNERLKVQLELLGINFSKKLSSNDFQVINAPLLRKLAIEHLRNGDSDVANGFRVSFLATCDRTIDEYLAVQGQDGVWGTDIEATALAELFGFNLDIITNTLPMRCHNVGEHAPTITLINLFNTHWSYYGNALGDGNCLYNAMLLAFYDLTKEEGQEFPLVTDSSANFLRNAYNRMFRPNSINPEIAIEKQRETFAKYNRRAIKNEPLLNPLAIVEQQELLAGILASLPEVVQTQVAEDNAIAIQTACRFAR